MTFQRGFTGLDSFLKNSGIPCILIPVESKSGTRHYIKQEMYAHGSIESMLSRYKISPDEYECRIVRMKNMASTDGMENKIGLIFDMLSDSLCEWNNVYIFCDNWIDSCELNRLRDNGCSIIYDEITDTGNISCSDLVIHETSSDRVITDECCKHEPKIARYTNGNVPKAVIENMRVFSSAMMVSCVDSLGVFTRKWDSIEVASKIVARTWYKMMAFDAITCDLLDNFNLFADGKRYAIGRNDLALFEAMCSITHDLDFSYAEWKGKYSQIPDISRVIDGVTEIWERVFHKYGISFNMTVPDSMDEALDCVNRIKRTRDALGIDHMISAFVDGMPVNDII